MPVLIRKSLDSPEEVRKFKAGSGQLELVNLDAGRSAGPPSSPAGAGPSTCGRSPRPTAARPPTLARPHHRFGGRAARRWSSGSPRWGGLNIPPQRRLPRAYDGLAWRTG